MLGLQKNALRSVMAVAETPFSLGVKQAVNGLEPKERENNPQGMQKSRQPVVHVQK